MDNSTDGALRSLAVPTFRKRDGEMYCAPLDRVMNRMDGDSVMVSAGTVSDEIRVTVVARGCMSSQSMTLTAAEAAALGAELIQAACFLQSAKHREAA